MALSFPLDHNRPLRRARRIALAGLAVALPALAAVAWWQGSRPTPPPRLDLEAARGAQPSLLRHTTLLPALELESRPAAIKRSLQVRRGDTLTGLLVGAGAERGQAERAVRAMKAVYDPRKLKVGQAIHLAFAAPGSGQGAAPGLLTLRLEIGPERVIQVARQPWAQDFGATDIARPLTRELAASLGPIDSSLFVAGRRDGVPTETMIELIRAFSFDVDFQREIWPGDSYELVFESYRDISGNLVKTGALLYAALILKGQRIELYRFTPASGRSDYFDPDGQSARRTLMRTPIDGARITSGFGRRKHPILGYNKMHRGTDFAAAQGTPIYAAGDGTIAHAGRKGAYGNYIRIRHNGTYQTAYAHLRSFAKGIRRGKRVKQGQVIGYVGTTGRSTGPHLHYEVHINGRQTNPLTIKLPSGEKLKGDDLTAFAATREETDRLRFELLGSGPLASRPCDPPAEAPTSDVPAAAPGC